MAEIELDQNISADRKVALLARFLSGDITESDLASKEGVSSLTLYQWKLEYSSRFFLKFLNREKRDETRPLKDRQILAIIPARGASKGLERKALKEIAGVPLIGRTIKAAKTSKYINRVVVTTDDEEIAAVAREFGADTPFIRPPELAQDNTSLSLTMMHALLYLELVEDYWHDFHVQLLLTYALRTGADIDLAFEAFLKTNYRTLISIDPVPLEEVPYYSLGTDHKLVTADLEVAAPGKPYRQSSFIYINARRPNYHIHLSDYNVMCGPVPEKQVFITPIDKAIDIDHAIDLQAAELALGETPEQNLIADFILWLGNFESPVVQPAAAGCESNVGIIYVAAADTEWKYRDVPMVCLPIFTAVQSGLYPSIVLIGDHPHLEDLAKWCHSSFIKVNDRSQYFRPNGLPTPGCIRQVEELCGKTFSSVGTINARMPFGGYYFRHAWNTFLEVGRTVGSASLASPHPAWTWTIQDGSAVPKYKHPEVGQRQLLSHLFYVHDGCAFASRKDIMEGDPQIEHAIQFIPGNLVQATDWLSYLRIRIKLLEASGK